MSPQTRSRTSGGAVQSSIDSMVPKTAPKRQSKSTSDTKESKVYQRSDPTPQQIHFPARSKTVRTYSKWKARRSLPSKLIDQSTLTQIGWIPSTFQEEDDMDGLIDLTDGYDNDTHQADGRKTTRRNKRRRRRGDYDIVPDSTAASSFHTQTLTQMSSFMSGQQPEDDEVLQDPKSDDDEQHVATKAVDTDNKFESPSPKRTRKRSTPSPQTAISLPPHGTVTSHMSQTPRKQIVGRAVIPSSQPSPFTPNLGIVGRYWDTMDATPLKERSTNFDAATPSVSKKRPRTLNIANSWSTVNGGMISSPSRDTVCRTPLKELNLNRMAEMSVILGETPIYKEYSTTAKEMGDSSIGSGICNALEGNGSFEGVETKGFSHQSIRSAGDIIFDSEDEFDLELEDDSGSSDEAPSTPTPAARALTLGNAKILVGESEALGPFPSQSARLLSKRPTIQRDHTPDPLIESDKGEPETPSPSPHRRPSVSSAVELGRETPLSSPQKTSPALPPPIRLGPSHEFQAIASPQKISPEMPPVSQLGHRYKSQAFESQRVPFERIQQLGPQTDRSDIILSIHPEHADKIVEGVKTHEFRNYRIPQTVGRIWIYITRPVGALKYMATISSAKEPGEISSADPGVGNEEFNAGKGAKFAYELKQVYQLNNPVSLSRMKQNGWVEEAPAKYVYVPPAVLGELMGNLRCALFAEPGEPQSSQVDLSVSQEVELQLRSDIAHSTQVENVASSPPRRVAHQNGEAGTIPFSQRNAEADSSSPAPETIAATNKPIFAKPAVPRSRSQRSVQWVEDSPVGRRSQPSQRVEEFAVRPSQATTASAPSSPSQQIVRLRGQPVETQYQSQPLIPRSPHAKTAPRPQMGRGSSSLLSDLAENAFVDDSSERSRKGETQSSALLGSSQGLGLGNGEPDSLLDDSRVRQPPVIIWDSEGEEV